VKPPSPVADPKYSYLPHASIPPPVKGRLCEKEEGRRELGRVTERRETEKFARFKLIPGSSAINNMCHS
jgi:hypothetical protein